MRAHPASLAAMAETDPLSPVTWDADGAPRSRAFGDVYFSKVDGLAEARAVFLAGCGLPDAWAGRDRFTVAELGFGSGLNILALLALWRRTRPACGRLHIFSVEAFPMSVQDAGRALAAWPEIADLAAMLLAHWPRRAHGFHRIDLPGLDASLDLAVMDVTDALDGWSGAADAWFLDGFSPACNPGMWSQGVFDAVARRSALGARAATFTVAGAVRRGLAAAGFEVAKAPGFGRKRERLEARLPAAPAPAAARPSVAIVGAGVAGASLARAFTALGFPTQVFEAASPGAGASGNPAALAMPRLDAGGGPIAQLYAQALARAADLYAETPDAVIARGVLQFETGPKDTSRFARIAASDLFAEAAVQPLSRAEMDARLGEPAPTAGLALSEAVVVEPAAVLSAWLGDTVQTVGVAEVVRVDGGWSLRDGEDREIARADVVCLAAGLASCDLAPDAPLSSVRGQVGSLAGMAPPVAAIGGGYLIPTRDGLLFGATHDRDDSGDDARPADTTRNLTLLAQVRPELAGAIDPAQVKARAGVRAVTPDFLPLAGALQPGLFILSGLGSRGFCAAPLLAEHVAAVATGAPSPLPRALAAIVDPHRFEARRRRRSGETKGQPIS
jgi:tRNA 5-methylaminomethyl-2-thiouridine biosynthesis bifunctional protein